MLRYRDFREQRARRLAFSRQLRELGKVGVYTGLSSMESLGLHHGVVTCLPFPLRLKAEQVCKLFD